MKLHDLHCRKIIPVVVWWIYTGEEQVSGATENPGRNNDSLEHKKINGGSEKLHIWNILRGRADRTY